MGKNMYVIECEKVNCENLCYYGATVCNNCQDWPYHKLIRKGVNNNG